MTWRFCRQLNPAVTSLSIRSRSFGFDKNRGETHERCQLALSGILVVKWQRTVIRMAYSRKKRLRGKGIAAGVCAALALLANLACGSGANSGNGGGGTNNPPPLLRRLSTDIFSNSTSQHATEVEPSIAGFGSTLVAVFQMGRFFDAGASAIAFATSSDNGASWQNGVLPGITVFTSGIYNAVSDPSVAYDRAHGTWMIASLAILGTDTVVVSRSQDGLNWSGPVTVSNTPDADKPWTTCDNSQASPYYGHCYMAWDDPSTNGLFWMSTSTDGGQTWSAPANTGDIATGIGGVPVVQPNGTVVVPASDDAGAHMLAFLSADGGSTWSSTTIISTISDHIVAGNLRNLALPMSAIDAAGVVYVVWPDCRFRTGCTSNGIVLSTSSDGMTWTKPVRIPIDAVSSTVDHFLAAIAADPSSSGSSAHLALVYHDYPEAACTEVTCALNVAYVTSQDGGASWSAPSQLAGPMSLGWLANTKLGGMVGDYMGVAYSLGFAFPAIAVARSNSLTIFDEAIYSTTNPLTQARAAASVERTQPRPGARSDHPQRRFYDLENRYPRNPPQFRSAKDCDMRLAPR